MVEQPEYVRHQLELTAHLRDPEHSPPPPDIEPRRVAIYRDLIFNNVESLLAGNFPVTREILGEDAWRAMIRDFFIRHRATTPLFLELAQELLEYLQDEREPAPRDPPFLLELCHYEWVELALYVSDEETKPGDADPNGDLLQGCPVVSPLAWNLSYRFPVHRISPDFRPDEPGTEPTRLVVYRNRQDKVEFLEINAVTQRLLQLLQENPDWNGLQTMTRIAEELQHPQPTQVITAGKQLLNDLHARNIILGTRRRAT